MQYKGRINATVAIINNNRNYNEIAVYRESGMYVITRFGRRISPELTAKECYKTLETLEKVLF